MVIKTKTYTTKREKPDKPKYRKREIIIIQNNKRSSFFYPSNY